MAKHRRPKNDPRILDIDGVKMVRDIARTSKKHVAEVIADIINDEGDEAFSKGSIEQLIYLHFAATNLAGFTFEASHRSAAAYAIGIRVGVAIALAGRDEALDQCPS